MTFTGGVTFNDSTGGGAFVAESSNTITGTVPSGQSVAATGSVLGNGVLSVSGAVTNNETITLDSTSSAQYANMTGSGTLTNNGLVKTVQDPGNIRYIEVNLTNGLTGTVEIAAADTRQDTGTHTINNGTWLVDPGGATGLTLRNVVAREQRLAEHHRQRHDVSGHRPGWHHPGQPGGQPHGRNHRYPIEGTGNTVVSTGPVSRDVLDVHVRGPAVHRAVPGQQGQRDCRSVAGRDHHHPARRPGHPAVQHQSGRDRRYGLGQLGGHQQRPSGRPDPVVGRCHQRNTDRGWNGHVHRHSHRPAPHRSRVSQPQHHHRRVSITTTTVPNGSVGATYPVTTLTATGG